MHDSARKAEADRAFAAYGRVMAKIGGFEQFMRIALGEQEIRRRQAAKQMPDIHAFGRRVLKMDFGGLAQQICQQFEFGPELRTVMKEAKTFRNHLAHNFWVAHFSNLHTARGVEIIVSQCLIHEHQFERLSDLLIKATGVNADGYVQFLAGRANDEDNFREWESRLEAARKVLPSTEAESVKKAMDNEPEQDALFEIEGLDEDGCVWISSTDAPGWHHNLGPADKVAEVLSQWLASLDDAGRDYRETQDE